MHVGIHVKYPLFLWGFNDTFSKNAQIPNFIKIRPMGAQVFHAGGRTDRQADITEPILAFPSFANVLKNRLCLRVFM